MQANNSTWWEPKSPKMEAILPTTILLRVFSSSSCGRNQISIKPLNQVRGSKWKVISTQSIFWSLQLNKSFKVSEDQVARSWRTPASLRIRPTGAWAKTIFLIHRWKCQLFQFINLKESLKRAQRKPKRIWCIKMNQVEFQNRDKTWTSSKPSQSIWIQMRAN